MSQLTQLHRLAARGDLEGCLGFARARLSSGDEAAAWLGFALLPPERRGEDGRRLGQRLAERQRPALEALRHVDVGLDLVVEPDGFCGPPWPRRIRPTGEPLREPVVELFAPRLSPDTSDKLSPLTTLVRIEVEQGGIAEADLAVLEALPCLQELVGFAHGQLLPSALRSLRARRPDLWFDLPCGSGSLAMAMSAVNDAVGRDPTARAAARAVWEIVLESDDSFRAAAVVLPLFVGKIVRSRRPKECLGISLAFQEALRLGADIGPAMLELVRGLEQLVADEDFLRHGQFASFLVPQLTVVTRTWVDAGHDPGPLLPALAACGLADEALAAVRAASDPAHRAGLVALNRTFFRGVIERVLAGDDVQARAAAQRVVAAGEGAREHPELPRALAGGLRDPVHRLDTVRAIRDLPPKVDIRAVLPELARALHDADRDVALDAGWALLHAVEAGADLEAVRHEIEAALCAPQRHSLPSASHALSLHLRRRGEEPDLPAGASHRRVRARSDEPLRSGPSSPCLACGSPRTALIAQGEEAGAVGRSVWWVEAKCRACGRYSLTEGEEEDPSNMGPE